MKKNSVLTSKAYILLAMSIVLIVIGVCAGQSASVWKKAAAICLECIGIA